MKRGGVEKVWKEDFKTQEQVWKQPYIHRGLILGWVLTRQCVGFFCCYV